MKIDFGEFVYLWFKLQSLKLPTHQYKIAKWLSKIWHQETNRQALLMAFRNSGKSTIVGLFCAWVLHQNNAVRILVMAADYSLAKKMVRNVKRIIEQHPLTKKLKPSRLDQWASDQFTINRDLELRDPSMLAKGLGANITGLRADLIICDDVEVPKNCDTSLKRQDMRERLDELDYILTPDGMQLYIGTPHSFYTIYQTQLDDSKPEVEPFLLNFEKLEIPILNKLGKSTWPERFTEAKIASIRMRSGENKFMSQMMLQPVNIKDSVLNPERLNAYDEELSLTFANEREILKIGEHKMVSASTWWDPSFAARNGDNSVIACVFIDEEGKYWLHDIVYLKIDAGENDNIASLQCEKVVDFLEKNHLSSLRIEVNGIGKFLPGVLKQVLGKRKVRAAVLEVFSNTNKEKRILEAFEVLLAERALNVHQRIWQSPFIEEMREWSVSGSTHDDALDAVAGCLASEPLRLPFTAADSKDIKVKNWQGSSQLFYAKANFEL